MPGSAPRNGMLNHEWLVNEIGSPRRGGNTQWGYRFSCCFYCLERWSNMPWEWSQRLFALKVNTGESEVMRAMHNFVPDCERTIGEPGWRTVSKSECNNICRDYARKLNTLQNDSGMHGNSDIVPVTSIAQVHQYNEEKSGWREEQAIGNFRLNKPIRNVRVKNY